MDCLFVSYNSLIMEYSRIIIILILCGIDCIWGELDVSTRRRDEFFIQNYPFMAGLVGKQSKDLYCSASIIGKYWAITTADCASKYHSRGEDEEDEEDVVVRGNTTMWIEQGNTELKVGKTQYATDHKIIDCIIHDFYSKTTHDYDVALLKVKEPFDGVFEKPIKYAIEDRRYLTGSHAAALSWGYGKLEDEYTFKLPSIRHVTTKLENDIFCSRTSTSNNTSITPRMICGSASGEDLSENGFGEPLIQFVPDAVLLGIRSWGGEGSARKNIPAVYTNLAALHGWILDRLQRDQQSS